MTRAGGGLASKPSIAAVGRRRRSGRLGPDRRWRRSGCGPVDDSGRRRPGLDRRRGPAGATRRRAGGRLGTRLDRSCGPAAIRRRPDGRLGLRLDRRHGAAWAGSGDPAAGWPGRLGPQSGPSYVFYALKSICQILFPVAVRKLSRARCRGWG